MCKELFDQALRQTVRGGLEVHREFRLSGGIGICDVAVLDGDRLAGVIEIKAPMTDRNGVKHKTRRPQGLPEDAKKLRATRSTGAEAIEMFAIFEVYGLTAGGQPEPPLGRSITQYERDIKGEFDIKWPTRHDLYEGTWKTRGRGGMRNSRFCD